jgi:hypothetical protein
VPQIELTVRGKPRKIKRHVKRVDPRKRRYSIEGADGFNATMTWLIFDPLTKARSDAARLSREDKGGRTAGHVKGIRLKTLLRKQADARREVKRIIRHMKATKQFIPDNETSEEAMQGLLEILRGPGDARNKIQAAKALLEYTQKKPVAASEVTLNNAESFLDAVLADEKKARDDARAARSAEDSKE